MAGALISGKDCCSGNDEGPSRERSDERRSGGSGSRCRSCRLDVDYELHLMIAAVVAFAANVPLPPFWFQRDAVLSALVYIVRCRETAIVELCLVHFHHVVLRFFIVEHCHKSIFILGKELQTRIITVFMWRIKSLFFLLCLIKRYKRKSFYKSIHPCKSYW